MQATDMPAFSNVLSIPTTHTHMGNSAVDKPRKIQLGQERVEFRKRIKTILLYVTISATAATHP